jgi:hypothetical protein
MESQTVTVEADALAVQADSNVVSTLITAEQISEIATENRSNFAALASLGLGVSSAIPDSNTPTAVGASFYISVNGLRQSHNIWLIDGGEADDRGGAGGMDIMPSQDAIAEFTVLASNYPPDYGISSGATMSLSLKSGTQKFHGEVYEFNRNTDYDANNYFNKLSTPVTPRTSTHYNIYGGNLGGPLFIPHVYNTNRQHTFFFWNEEWRKLLISNGTNEEPVLDAADIPTAGQNLHYVPPPFDSGNEIDVPVVGDPNYNRKLAALGLTPGQPFPNQTVPASLLDPNAVLYLNRGIIPKANAPNDQNITNLSNPVYLRDDIIRVDHKWNDKWQILGHYMHDSVTQGYAQPYLGWLWASYNTIGSTLSNPSNSAALKLSGTISPSLLLESSINYDGNIINIANNANADKPAGWSASTFFNNGNPYLPGFVWNFPYYVGEQIGSAPWHNAAEDFEPKVDISYTQGKHAMKFGFSYNRYTKNQQLFGSGSGSTGFNSLTNDTFVDMMLGLTYGFNQFQDAYIRHYVNQTPSAYVMDNWHVTPRLSLQLGIRYDALPHAWERNDAVANFVPGNYQQSEAPAWNSDGSLNPRGPGFQTVAGVPNYLNGMGLEGVNGFPHGLVTNDYNTWQPRVGFSEDLFGNGKTVLRGGFGTFFERLQGNDIYAAAANPPFAFSPTNSNTYLTNPSKSWVTGLTASIPFYPSAVTNLSQHYPAPAVAQYSLGVQRELMPSVIWVIQYVGNLAWDQSIVRSINDFPLNEDLAVRCDAGDGSDEYSSNAGPDRCPATTLTGTGALGANTPPPVGANGAPSSLPNGAIYDSYQGYGAISQEENSTNGTYNGFQTGVRFQNKWGLSGEVDYTYSHEIDITSGDLGSVSNPWNLKYDKASGSLDRRHMLNSNYVYKLPIFARSKGLLHSLVGGWEVAGTAIDQTGLPSAPGFSAPYDPVGLGGGYSNRPNIGGKMGYPHKFGEWFNTGMLTVPIPAWLGGPNQGFGNSRRDSIVLPGRVNFSTSLYKSFAVTERAHFELRFESFNTFNHTEYNSIDSSIGTSQYGQVTATQDPRTLELAGKFVF